MNKSIEEIKNELRDPSLHFRPECEGFRCGAHRSWDEGFDAGYAEMEKRAQMLVEALEWYADPRSWCEGDTPGWQDTIDQDDLVEYEFGSIGGLKAREAVEKWRAK